MREAARGPARAGPLRLISPIRRAPSAVDSHGVSPKLRVRRIVRTGDDIAPAHSRAGRVGRPWKGYPDDMRSLAKGLVAGAVGTELLNVTTYLDMALSGRSSSSTPQEDVQKLADRVGLDLGDASTAENRKTALGAVLGYVTGASIGVTYALARQVLPPLPIVPGAVVVGLAAMAATDASSAALGTTDPRSWSAHAWISDLIPHVAFGAGVVATYEALDRA